MNKDKLLFSKEYENFYEMAENNDVLSKYCEEVFGIDFSQDGYSDLVQIKDLIKAADIKPGHKVLDIGCGNGKMADFIADQTGATVYGFDYSENAIKSAKKRTKGKKNLLFEEGIIGEKQYEQSSFDVIMSVDTIYFALEMEAFVKQVYGWLKPGGSFAVFYEEGHLKEISDGEDSTELARTFAKMGLEYLVVDYTKQHYELMRRKREVITRMKKQFISNNMRFYYYCCKGTSISHRLSLERFRKKFRRYLYVVRKKTTD